MKIRIKKIPIALAQPEMTLGAPVLDQQGRTLLVDGIELSEEKLESLRRHEILCVSILDEDNRSEDELAEARQQETERINALFRGADKTAHQALLQQLILEHRLQPLL